VNVTGADEPRFGWAGPLLRVMVTAVEVRFESAGSSSA
jgi:hypothetical protein